MRRFRNTIFSVVLVLVMVISLSACGNTTTGTTNTPQPSVQPSTSVPSESATPTEKPAEEATLVLWTIATESDAFHPAYTQAIADFETAHPGIKIQHETFENESYKTKIKSAVAANELPDIFFTWGGGFSQAFVESGKVLPLDSYYTEEFKAQLSAAALGNATYNGKIYGSVYSTPVSMMFYNKKMFDANGLKAPTTFDELVTVCQTFLSKGIEPIGISVKDTWVLAMTHDALTLKSAGPGKVKSVLTKQGGSYNNPDFIESAKKIKQLVDMGAFIKSATGSTNDEASALLYNGTVPMYVTGTWMAGSIQTDAPNPADFDVTPIPVINGTNAKITDFMGGASDTLMVAASTKYPDIAGNAAFELTRSVSKYAYLSGAGIAAWTVDYDDSKVNPLTKKAAEFATGATSFTLWFDTLMAAENAGEYLSLLQELYVGNITPEEFAQSMADQLGQ